MEQEVEKCKEQEAAARWRRDLLEWEGDGQGKKELERGEEVQEQSQFPLEGGLADVLTCSYCRHTFTKGWNKFKHRYSSDNLHTTIRPPPAKPVS